MEAGAVEKAHKTFSDLLKISEVLDAIAKDLCDDISKIEVVERGRGDAVQYNLPWAHPIRRIQEIEVPPALDGDAFTFFSGEEYSTHPWHQHFELVQGINVDINKAVTSLHRFCEESFTYYDSPKYWYRREQKRELCFNSPHWKHVKLKEDITDEELRTFIRKSASTLTKVSEKIRGNIILLQDTYYPKPWAVKIAMMHGKNTPQRGDAIRDMINNNRVPKSSKRLISDLIKFQEGNRFFVHDEWKPVGNNRRRGMTLALLPVAKCQWKKPSITPLFYAPPKLICLRDYFGMEREVRLYFSPRQFPTPIDLWSADICDSFNLLRYYIIEQSKKEGELSCRGGSKPGCSVRFSCTTKTCKFHFVLKWDKYGYYIHYHNVDLNRFVGCAEHNH